MRDGIAYLRVMLVCPSCGDEFHEGITHCPDCDVELAEPGAPPPPPRVDALLGRFRPEVAERVLALVAQKGISHEAMHTGDETEVLVPTDWRDDLRAELVINWQELIGSLPQETVFDVLAEGGMLPGWRDAPTGAWVDREGRLQVDRPDDLAEEDARRVLGPTLVGSGIVAALIGWYVGGDVQPWFIVLGLGAAGTGVFLPR